MQFHQYSFLLMPTHLGYFTDLRNIDFIKLNLNIVKTCFNIYWNNLPLKCFENVREATLYRVYTNLIYCLPCGFAYTEDI